MDDQELLDLEDPDNWDFENVQIQEPLDHRRAIVSVAVCRDDFKAIAAAARKCGMTVTAFMRLAATEKAVHIHTRSSHEGIVSSDFEVAVHVGSDAAKP